MLVFITQYDEKVTYLDFFFITIERAPTSHQLYLKYYAWKMGALKSQQFNLKMMVESITI